MHGTLDDPITGEICIKCLEELTVTSPMSGVCIWCYDVLDLARHRTIEPKRVGEEE